ncbi:MAG: twin-arginine translocase TatA/TatE family subunit [Legionellaceae bacterium]|nr:twin-arginine translocase TatA/TatE family subunit [Legionellaceae bacterium]
MSLAEVLVILLVALLVWGPTKLPMLLRHAFHLKKKLDAWQQQWQAFWQAQVKEQALLENQERAKEADKYYQQNHQAQEPAPTDVVGAAKQQHLPD